MSSVPVVRLSAGSNTIPIGGGTPAAQSMALRAVKRCRLPSGRTMSTLFLTVGRRQRLIVPIGLTSPQPTRAAQTAPPAWCVSAGGDALPLHTADYAALIRPTALPLGSGVTQASCKTL